MRDKYKFGILYQLMNWRKVRTLGELQVITKASYIMLIVVPILAGIWPGVRMGLNSYNKTIEESIILLENASIKFEYEAQNSITFIDSAIQNDLISKAENTIDTLNTRIDNLIQNYSNLTIEKKNLPNIWVIVFLAALSIFIAQLVYQSNAPSAIRRDGFDDFIINRKSDYASNPNNSGIDRSMYFIELYREDLLEKLNKEKSTKTTPDELKKWELDVIEAGATGEYLLSSQQKIGFAWLSGFFYYVGILLLIIIIFKQTISVLMAAGWI